MSQRVLIVDDEPNIVISLEFLLKREGFAVSVARDGEEGLAAIRAHSAGEELPQRSIDVGFRLIARESA